MKYLIILGVFLSGFYFMMFFLSFSGWGYAGYRGYHYGPTFWYWGGAHYYPSTSARTGSAGSGSRSGGSGFGK